MNDRPDCGLCDAPFDLVPALVEYAEPIPDPVDPERPALRFDSMLRCRDRAACRQRVEASGRPWTVLDAHRPSDHVAPPAAAPASPDHSPAPAGPVMVPAGITDDELDLLDDARPW